MLSQDDTREASNLTTANDIIGGPKQVTSTDPDLS